MKYTYNHTKNIILKYSEILYIILYYKKENKFY